MEREADGFSGHEQPAAGGAAVPAGSQGVASLVTRVVPLTVCVGALLMAGCGGPQSALDPAGRGAERIADLFWWMAAGAAIIWLAVIGLAIYAMRVRPEAHSQRASAIS